jgi:hypothetical protein
MVSLTINDSGSLTAIQRDLSPTVYLDHWAIRELSEDASLASRFVNALRVRGGTLALSWANLVEFGGVTSEHQARAAEEFIEANLPRVFFLEVDPFLVIGRENALLDGGPPSPPHADPEFLRLFVGLKPHLPHPLTARSLFEGVQGGLGKVAADLADALVSRIESLRTELQADSAFQNVLRRPPIGPQVQRGTRTVLLELARALIVDQQTKMDRHHAMDFFHAVVPVSYCDFVLLDKYWETQVERVRRRLAQAVDPVPIAAVFSKKGNGIERLVQALELTA